MDELLKRIRELTDGERTVAFTLMLQERVKKRVVSAFAGKPLDEQEAVLDALEKLYCFQCGEALPTRPGFDHYCSDDEEEEEDDDD